MFEYLEIITEALSTLTVNKLRSGLAMLGIVIGIGSVITLISLGQSSQQAVQSQIQSIGSNLLTISPGFQSNGGVRGAAGGGTSLTYEDAQAIATATEITTVEKVSPIFNSFSQVIAGRSNTNTQIVGVTPTYAEIRNLSFSTGRFFSEQELSSAAKVAVLGPTVVTDLYGEATNPVGQTLRINGKNFQVIGVTKSKGGTGFQNQDDMIFIPLTTAQKQVFGVKYLSSIELQVINSEQMTQAQNQVGYFLLARHKLSDPAQADFRIRSQQDILEAATAVSGTFTTLLSGVAAISLLVGGIGIMNIMLVTVTERTREIGLRKALGAKKKTIITQFLVESVILTFSGGALGIVLGIGASYGYSLYTASTFALSLPSILLAFGVSAIIGVVFGWYPARRAANLQPIEALRFE